MTEAIPLLHPNEDGPRFTVAGDDGSLSIRRPFHQRRKPGLGLAQLNFSHDGLPKAPM